MSVCPICNGTKKIRSMGMMTTECPTCEGTGKVSKEVVDKHHEAKRNMKEPIKPQLPDNFLETKQCTFKDSLKEKNYGFRNQPVSINKDIQNTPANTQMTDAQIAALKSQIKPRDADDMMSAQRVIDAELVAESNSDAAGKQIDKRAKTATN